MTANMKDKTYSKTYPSLRYKPVELGGLVNHYGFYLASLGVAIVLLLVIAVCVANGEAIDNWFSEVLKSIFL